MFWLPRHSASLLKIRVSDIQLVKANISPVCCSNSMLLPHLIVIFPFLAHSSDRPHQESHTSLSVHAFHHRLLPQATSLYQTASSHFALGLIVELLRAGRLASLVAQAEMAIGLVDGNMTPSSEKSDDKSMLPNQWAQCINSIASFWHIRSPIFPFYPQSLGIHHSSLNLAYIINVLFTK